MGPDLIQGVVMTAQNVVSTDVLTILFSISSWRIAFGVREVWPENWELLEIEETQQLKDKLLGLRRMPQFAVLEYERLGDLDEIRRFTKGTYVILIAHVELPLAERIKLLQQVEDIMILKFDNWECELIARIEAALRRIPEQKFVGMKVWVNSYVYIDLIEGVVVVRGVKHSLTPTELLIMQVLMLHWGKPVDSLVIIELVWVMLSAEERAEFGDPGNPNSLRVHVHRLRKELEEVSRAFEIITTVRAGTNSDVPSGGYMLVFIDGVSGLPVLENQ